MADMAGYEGEYAALIVIETHLPMGGDVQIW